MTTGIRRILFLLFFLSGFASLVYQVVWTRMAFAAFGIITPVLSVVLSVFMLGLGAGAWAGGKYIGMLVKKTGRSAAIFYGLAELVIGMGAFVVPQLFELGRHMLLASGETNSFGYLALSALALAIAILPWCLCMGTTFPLMMAFVRERDPRQKESFSFLYLANVLGAMSGTFLTAIAFVEILGFRGTLWVAAAANFLIALISLFGIGGRIQETPGEDKEAPAAEPSAAASPMIKWLLFATGFIAMAMEVVWTRAFTPVLKTQVYSFALIVVTYLGATFAGSWWYRRHLRRGAAWPTGRLLALLATAALLPVLANDSRLVTADWLGEFFETPSAVTLMASICPFCALLGYLTPSLIDQGAAGRPAAAGRLYAVNILGCILGPLFACYLLLPNLSERYDLILLSLPLFAFLFGSGKAEPGAKKLASSAAFAAALAWALFGTRDFETSLRRTMNHIEVRRDYAASVIAFGDGMGKNLLVNGVGMTRLTPLAKLMVHLPMAYHKGPPQSALVICFGMGTSFRSAMSWGVDTTVVELVPGVTESFDFFHADAAEIRKNPRAHIVIDDGRRFLQRTTRKFDVIVVDPPPPVEAAGSSLLFSEEFYRLARQRLNPGGVVQMWFPGGDVLTSRGVVRAAAAEFPQVRCFMSLAQRGFHLLASEEPLEELTADQLKAKMPKSAMDDLLEWYPQEAPSFLPRTVANEASVPVITGPSLKLAITDDHPLNEYYLLRQWVAQNRTP